TLAVVVLRCRSRGSVRLRSADPSAPPVITPGYFSDPAEMATMVAGLRVARRWARCETFSPYRGAEIWPGAGIDSDQDLEAFVRRTCEPLYHPAGTCRMGNDAMAVVDDGLRVHGLGGLRVVDASIMPTLIGGHPNAPTIMIAEKAADLLGGIA